MAKGKRKARPNAAGRNTTEQFFTVPYATAHSRAWRHMTGAELKVWIELRTRFAGGNNGILRLSYEEASRLLHLSKSSVARAFEGLQKKGFIRLKRRGRFLGRWASEWIVTDCTLDGHNATRDFMHWKPGDDFTHGIQKIGTEAAPSDGKVVSLEYPLRANGAA